VGFLLASIHTGVSPQLWPPLVDAAEALGVELFIFAGGRLKAEDPTEATRTRLYSLATERNLDGAVSWASSLGGFVGSAELDEFHSRLGELPLVAMAHHLPGKPVVRIDAYSGMLSLMDHMISAHGIRRMAFIRGPQEHESAEDRKRAFFDAHRKAGLDLDPRLVASPRPWNEGQQAVEELIDGRGLIPGRDFDALLAASDLQLYSAVLALQGRGYSVPADLLTAGFNDSIESRILSPAVTTVRLPFAEQALRAFRALIARLGDEAGTIDETLSSELVVRQSCGCLSASVREAGRRARGGAASRAELYTAILGAASRACGASLEERSAWMTPLVDDFLSAVGSSSEAAAAVFLRTLDRVMERLIRMDRALEPWQDVLSAFRAESLARVSPTAREAVEDLVGQGRVIVSEALVRSNSRRVWKASVTAQIIRDIERDLIRLQGREELGAILSRHLPSLGIRAAFVVEEEGGTARLIAGFNERGILGREVLKEFDGSELLPPALAVGGPGLSWIIEPLCTGEEYFGRLVIRVGTREATVYEELRGALASSLQGLRAVDELRRARAAAEKAEALKSRFLAGVSVEMRLPLKGIVEAADSVERTLAGKKRLRRPPAAAAEALSFIRGAADRQLTLTDDLLDLARCEVGELQLSTSLVRPEDLVARAVAVAGSPVDYREPGAPLPLVAGDPARLSRLLALLFDRARPAEVSVRAEACFLAFSILRSDGRAVPPEDEGGLGRSVSFARRMVSAHCGRLESVDSGGRPIGWILRLPYPALGGGVCSAPADGRIVLLSDEEVPPRRLDSILGDALVQVVSPGRAKAEPSALEGVASIAWAPPAPPREAAEAMLLRTLTKNPVFASLPFLFFPRDAASAIGAAEPADLISVAAGTANAGAVVVLDADRERGAALASALSGAGEAEAIAAASPEEAAALAGNMFPKAVVVRSPTSRLVGSVRSGEGLDHRRPTLIVLCDLLDDQTDLSVLEADPRAVLLNEGIFPQDELYAFIRSFAAGRSPLPAYTGAIVKKAQLYLNRRYSTSITRWKIADAINVSEDYLTRVFKKELGISPWEYLIRLRIHVARRMLREGAESVRAVAEATGFQDQAYFCRVFRKIEGCTPSSFRTDGEPGSD
jgi:DNA-binding LacI/PurR family transcriptional regulator/AraC-like DNA-binding protein/signal transduction histidine kinase